MNHCNNKRQKNFLPSLIKIDNNKPHFIFDINGNALNIYAKDDNGKNVLHGSILLDHINTIPISINTNCSIVQKYTNPPYKVIYIDQPSTWYPYDKMADDFYQIIDAGFNVINLAFIVNGQPSDMCIAWNRELAYTNEKTNLPYRIEILNYAHQKGCSILASVGGATDNSYAKSPAIDYATQACNYVLNNFLDGIDYDLEFINPGFIAPYLRTSSETIQWLVDLSNYTRDLLGHYALISHAPQQPYMNTIGQSHTWAGESGGYSAVDKQCTSIDFYNVQCYNQGNDNYNSYQTIFVDSGINLPYSAFNQTGIPLNKLVMGKPMRQSDASTGYQSSDVLHQILADANIKSNYIGNIMTWQYPYNETNPGSYCKQWLNTITANN